jgi:SpoVK/Ycf46/Vps4 family AAA+-type ATPase
MSEVLLLDEADILLGERGEASHHVDQAVTAEFLRWLELFEGVFVCATNHPGLLDAALMRRFVFRLEFRPLGTTQRADLYRELAMGWEPRAGSAPELASALSLRLDRLPFLTAGDFANVARRARALRLGTEAWIDELEAEHAAKDRTASCPIGFMS